MFEDIMQNEMNIDFADNYVNGFEAMIMTSAAEEDDEEEDDYYA